MTNPIAALACFVGFAWAMHSHFRKSGKPTRGMILTGVMGSLSAIAHLAAVYLRPAAIPEPALVLYLASLALFWCAIGATSGKGLAACYLGEVPAQLVTAGPYRHIRNPFYTAYMLAWIAGAAATVFWPLAVTVPMMAALYHRAARQEERELEVKYGEIYRQYKKRTGRYLPLISTGSGRSGQ